jgi:hypothetical protein
MRFGNLVGGSVDVPEGSAEGAELAHQYTTRDGGTVTVLRSANGRFVKGCQMHAVIQPEVMGRKITSEKTRLRRALGLPANDYLPNSTFPRRKK